MSYPRNAVSPPTILLGEVRNMTDGAIQTSGVSVVVKPEGGSETAGAGTLVKGTVTDIWYYTPTQAETDFTAFHVVAYKTGCSHAATQVVTSANNTAGKVTVQTNDDKTGYALSQSFPANFAALGINASGHVSRVTLVDTTTANSDMRGTDNALLAGSYVAPDNAGIADALTRLPDAPPGGEDGLPVLNADLKVAAALDSSITDQIDNIENASGYILAVLAGACADPQTASETYAITVFGSTFTVDMAGQTSTGTRTAPTLTKS